MEYGSAITVVTMNVLLKKSVTITGLSFLGRMLSKASSPVALVHVPTYNLKWDGLQDGGRCNIVTFGKSCVLFMLISKSSAHCLVYKMPSVCTQHDTTAYPQNFHKTQVVKVHNTKVYKLFAGLNKFLS